MKNLFTYLKALWSSMGNLQSKDISLDCRLTVGSPSGLDAKWKQNPFMRFAVVLTLIFTIGSGNVWAQTTTTYTFSSKSWAASPANWTNGKAGNALTSGQGIQVTTGTSGANGTSPKSFTNVSKVVITYSTNASKGAGSIAVKIGSNTANSQNVTKTGGTTDRTLTYNFSPNQTGNVNVTVTCTTNSIYVKSVAITEAAAASKTYYIWDGSEYQTSTESGSSISKNPTALCSVGAAESYGWITEEYANTTAPSPRYWKNDTWPTGKTKLYAVYYYDAGDGNAYYSTHPTIYNVTYNTTHATLDEDYSYTCTTDILDLASPTYGSYVYAYYTPESGYSLDETCFTFTYTSGGGTFTPSDMSYNSATGELWIDGVNGNITITAVAKTCTKLADATNLVVQNPSTSDATKIKFTWTLGAGTSTNATKQVLTLSKIGGASQSVDRSKTQTSGSLSLSSLSDGTYNWSIQAIGDGVSYCDGNVVEGPSFTICNTDITSSTPDIVPDTPDKTSCEVLFDLTGANSYSVTLKNNSTNAVVGSYNNVSNTTGDITFTGLTPNTTYRVEVVAHNACGDNSLTGSETFTTAALTLYHVDFVNQSGAAVATVTQTTEGGNVTLPSASPSAACAALGWTFAGWKDGSAQTETTSAPTLIAAGSYTPQTNKTFYAVYTKTESGGGTPKTTLLSSTCADVENFTDADWPTKDTYYLNDPAGALRLGKSKGTGYITSKSLSAAVGTTIKVDFDARAYNLDDGGNINVTVSGCAQQSVLWSTYGGSTSEYTSCSLSFVTTTASFTVTIATSSKRAVLKNIEIYYGGGGSSTTYWNSNPSCSSTASVTYDGNGNTGGTAPTDANNPYTIGDEVTVLACPNTLVKSGKVFGCWNTQSDGLGTDYAPGATFDISGDITLYAKWVNPPYTVNFNAEGGTCGTASSTEASGGAGVTLPAATASCSAAGWSFYGWATSASTSTTSAPTTVGTTGATYYPTSAITLHAIYVNSGTYNSNPVCHEVTIGSHTNGTVNVNSSTTSPQSVTQGATVNIAATPSSGYNFTTWTITKTTGGNDVTSTLLGANATTASTSFTMPDYDVTVSATFTAKVMCTITWNVNGSTYTTGGPSDEAESGTKWSALTLPTAPADNTLSACDRTKFVGWSTSQLFGDGNSAPSDLFKSTSDDNADSHTITGTTTFYAVFAKGSGDGWEKVSSTPDNWCGDYLLAYEASASSVFVWNGSTDASNYVEATPSDGLISKPTGGVEITIEHFGETANYAIKVKEGTNKDKYFKGNSSNGFTLEDTQQNTTIGSVEDIGFTFTNSSSYLRFNTTSGQTRFRYYKSSTAKQSSYKTIALYQQASNYSDYATQCCTLKPVTNLAVSSTTANSVTLTWTAPSPTTGIDHLELRNASTDVKIGSNIAVGTTTTSVSGLVECNTYSYKIVSVGAVCETPSDVVEATPFGGSKTVTFNYNGGSGSPTSFTTSCAGNTVALPTPDTRTGYTFLGWWSAQNGGTKKGDAGDIYTVSGNTTIWAHWAQNFTVTYNRKGGTIVCGGSEIGVAGQTFTICTTEPTRSGYIFAGWDTEEGGTGTRYNAGGTFTMPSSDVTLYAQWTANWRNLTFNVPTDGGSITGGPAGNHVLDGQSFTMPTITGKSDSKWCWTFLGWTETAPNGSGRWDVTPSYIAGGATSGAITSDKVYYAVYSKTGAGASGTAELTCTDMYNWITTTLSGTANNYGTTTTHTAADGFTWQTNGQVTTVSQGAHLVIRGRTNSNGVSWIKLPTFEGNIREIRLEVSQGNSNTSCSNLGNNTENGIGLQAGTSNSETVITSSEHTSSKSRTITVTGSHTTGYLTIDYSASSSGATNIISIEVDYGPAAIYGYTLDDCGCVVTEFDLTYDANTANFPGSTITPCTGVTGYKWSEHDDEYTICSTVPTCDGYKFSYWATNANGSGTHYNPGEVITCVGETPITLYARYERVYTVTFNNQGVTTPVTQASEGAAIAVPSATSPCSAEWAFVGWSETAIAPMSMLPTIEIASGTSTYTPTADKTLYAIYRKTSTSDAFVAGMSGAYKITNGSTVYAGACNNSKLPETDAAGAAVFYIKYTSADGGKYTIQQSDGKYLKYSGSSTGLALNDAATPYYWTMAKNGTLWRVQSETAGRYLEHDAGTGFKAYTGSNTDLAFVAAEGQYYYRTMSCATEYDITFHDNGTTISWAGGYPEASYKDLADATVVSTFPTASFDGWTFLGWRTADYDESTTAPTASGIYSTGGNALTISSADVDLYPVFTRFEDNPPFDEINGGDYFIYFLEEGSDDGYGAARRVYAASYESHKRYNSSTLCSAATTFTFTKLENGNWTIYDNTTHMYLYGIENDDLKQQASATGAEWTLTINGNQFDAFHVGSSYGQLIAQGDGTSATIMNYHRTNVTTNPAMYHRVYLGSCTNRVFSSNPSTIPEIDLKGTVVVTASQNGAVRNTNVLTVSGHNLTPSTGEITITSNNSDVYFSLSTDKNFAKGVADQPKTSVTITANGSGIVTPTPVYVHYKPSSNTDTWTSATITASYTGAEDAEVTGELRTVKENFVIASKVGGNWYALPANMGAEGVFEPVLIDVDESAKIAYGPATVGYKMWPVQTVNGGTDEYAANGDKVRFAGNSNAGLWASNSNNHIRNWATITAIGSTAETPASYEWIIETEDREAYTLKSMYSTNYLDLYRPSSGAHAGKLVWASNSTNETNEIHFFPLTEREVITIIPREWKTTGLVFSVPADNQITAVSYKIGTGSETSTTYTRHSTGGYGLYEVVLPDLTSQYGKLLTLKLTISGTPTYATTTIPIIVNANASTKTNEPFATLGAATKDYDVVVLDGKTLTTDAASSGACNFQNLYIYPGATLVNAANNNLSVRYLELRGGIKGIDHKSDLAQGVPHLKLDKNFSSTAGANLDMCVNTAHSYALSVPFDVTLSTVNFANSLNTETSEPINGTLDAQFMIMEYDGEQRASTGKGWKHITSTERVLHAGEGYVLQGKRPKGQPFAVIRFPFSSVSGWADGSGEVVKSAVSISEHAGGASTPDNDKGWNLIANPYMATLSYNGADEGWAADFTVGSLVKTDTDPWDGKYKWTTTTNAYVTMPNEWYTEFPQYRANSAQAVFEPFKNFFIQASANGSVTFDKSKRASAPRHLLAQVTKAQPIYADINLTHGEAFAQAGLTVDENATAGYKFGEDQNIFENREALTYLKMYTVADGHYLVGNTMTPAETEELIPVEFYAPNAGEYIFSLDDNSDIDRLEYVILYDAVLGLNTNLLTNDYMVELDETGLIENRFSIGLRIKEKDNSATGIGDVSGDPERPYKFIYRDKMYILRGGKIYDATGKQVREIK